MEADNLKYVKSNNCNSHSPKKQSAYVKVWTEIVEQLHKLPKEKVQ
jgi:hypothetical protein